MKFAFWNVNKNKSINGYIAEIVIENDIDIVVLAEYEDDRYELINQLKNNNMDMSQYFTAGCDRIIILGKVKNVVPANQDKYYTVQVINDKYVLCGMHLPSQMYSGHQEMRNIIIQRILRDIRDIEKVYGDQNTILVGDMNENPYEIGCLSASNFHGIPCYEIAKKLTRTVSDETFKMFYNPMWNFFGDFNNPPGTYYYASGPNISFWNIYDQVMIRPGLRKKFMSDSLKILTKTKNKLLLNKNNCPNKDISDHLPIIFEIKE